MGSTFARSLFLLVILGVLVIPDGACGDVVKTLVYDPDDLTISDFQGYDLVEFGTLPIIGERGEPSLPVEAVTFELAPGEVIHGVEIIDLTQERIPGPFNPPPAELYLLNRAPDGLKRPQGRDPFPMLPVYTGGSGNLQGIRLGSILVYPVQWVPDGGDLLLTRAITVLVRTRHAEGLDAPVQQRGTLAVGPGRSWKDLIPGGAMEKGVLRGASSAGGPAEFRRLDDESAEYLIVTNEAMAGEFQRLADWKTARGIPAKVVTISWILSNYAMGVDTQECIRACLRDAYQNWGTRWVLLGGDSGVLPTRICHFTDNPFRTYEEGLVPCDLYYACLDGTWDGDGDGIFGERFSSPGLDLYPEVFLGRAPVNTTNEARVFVDKIFRYRKEPATDYQKRALFISHLIIPSPCPGMLHGSTYLEGAIRWVPEDFEITRLYECSSYYGGDHELNLNQAFNSMEEGYAVVGQVGHGDEFKMDCASGFFRRVHADSLANLDRLSLFVFLNCSTNNVDVDCLAEHLVRSERGGGIGFVGNTGYGFPSTASPYMQYFFKLLYASGVTTPGELAAYFRLQYVPMVSRSEYHRWTQYSYMLLGDPSVDLWIDTPRSLSVSHSGSIALTDSTYEVTVESDGAPASGVLACLWMKETGAYARGLTGSDGMVSLSFSAGATGEAGLVVIGKGYLPAEDVVTVTGSGRVHVDEVTVDDVSGGNGNGLLEAGEHVDLLVTLINDGDAAVNGVNATLGLIPAGHLDVDIQINGVQDPAGIWVGASGWQPAAVPFRLETGGEEVLGQPPLGQESRSGVWIWLDAGGWHVRCRSDADSLVATGTLTSDGGMLEALPLEFEGNDLLEIAGNVVQFTCVMDTCDFEDRIDLQLADSAGVHVLSGTQSVGDIAAGSGGVAGFAVESDAWVPDRRPVWFVLDLVAEDSAWSEWIRVELLASRLEVLYARVDDSAANGNGSIDPGETFDLFPSVVNWGKGQVGGVDLIVRAVSGAAVSDSLIHMGEVTPGTVIEAGEGFRLTATSAAPVLEVEFLAGARSLGRSSLELGALAAPDSLWLEPGCEQVHLFCRADTEARVRGYRFLRRDPGSGAFEYLDTVLQSGAYVDDGLVADRSYEYAVSVFDSAGALSPLSDPVTGKANPPLQEGFPADAFGESYGSPAAADLDRDGDLEIVVGTKDGRITAFHHDGTIVGGWPQWVEDEIWGSPALGDLDGDGDLEVIAGDRDGYLWVWNWDGSLFTPGNNPDLAPDAPGWPRETAGELRSAPTLADLDADGRPEILVSCMANAVYCWRYDGVGYADTTGVFAGTSAGVWGSPAVADLNGDSAPEVVVGTWLTGGLAHVCVWNCDGTDYLGSNPFAEPAGMIWTSPCIANIDSDPELEILLGTDAGILYAWNHDGTGVLEASGVFDSLKDSGQMFRSSPVVGDLDGDGNLEIIAGSDHADSRRDTVYAWRHDGTGAMPGGSRVVGTVAEAIERGYIPSSPALADIDGDGDIEILIGAPDGRVHAWDNDGTPLDGWPVRTRLSSYAAPGVADLDGDGDLEVFFAAYDALVHVWDLPGDPAGVEWGTFQQGPWRTGLYGFSPPPDTTAPVLEIGILQNPVLDRSLDFYVSSTKNLTGSPNVAVQFGGSEPDTLSLANLAAGTRDLHLCHAVLWADEAQTGVAQITGWGHDVDGNSGETQRQFVFKKMVAGEGGCVDAVDGGASLILFPGSLQEDLHILVASAAGRASAGWTKALLPTPLPGMATRSSVGVRYVIGPQGKALAEEAVVLLRIPAEQTHSEEPLSVCRLDENRWIPLPPEEAPAGWVGGRTGHLGVFELCFNHALQVMARTEITSNYPNPFNPETTIRFDLARGGRTVLTVHDVRGRLVATLIDEDLPSGVHHVRWDGANDEGRSVASGIYFCRLAGDGGDSSTKLVLLK